MHFVDLAMTQSSCTFYRNQAPRLNEQDDNSIHCILYNVRLFVQCSWFAAWCNIKNRLRHVSGVIVSKSIAKYNWSVFDVAEHLHIFFFIQLQKIKKFDFVGRRNSSDLITSIKSLLCFMTTTITLMKSTFNDWWWLHRATDAFFAPMLIHRRCQKKKVLHQDINSIHGLMQTKRCALFFGLFDCEMYEILLCGGFVLPLYS